MPCDNLDDHRIPMLRVGTRVLDAPRPPLCQARSRQEATRSVEEGIPTRERGNEKNRATESRGTRSSSDTDFSSAQANLVIAGSLRQTR